MDNKLILTIQDISCVGQCSLTAALPIISACGIETAILPSAVLSNHTGGFTAWTFRDLTEDMPLIREEWLRQNIKFDAFYTGYLGSAKQIAYVKDIFNTCGKPGALRIVDPAMADNGKLYPGFDAAFAATMGELCAAADYVLPNITEAALVTGMEYRETYDHAYISEMVGKLAAMGPKTVILTGVSFDPACNGVMVYENGEEAYYEHRRVSKNCHGTGDVFASAFTGALLHGHSSYEATKIAADFVVLCMENTIDDPNHWYGVKFEPLLGELIKSL